MQRRTLPVTEGTERAGLLEDRRIGGDGSVVILAKCRTDVSNQGWHVVQQSSAGKHFGGFDRKESDKAIEPTSRKRLVLVANAQGDQITKVCGDHLRT